MDDVYFVPGRCYRRGNQMMRVLGPLFPTVLPAAERRRWREVTEEEWNETLARVAITAAARVDGGQPLAELR